jgi:hypothetical protein
MKPGLPRRGFVETGRRRRVQHNTLRERDRQALGGGLREHGARVEDIGAHRLAQAAAGGGAISYLTNAPTESQPQGYSGFLQVLSTRGLEGWRSRDIATPNNTATGIEAHEYVFFSEDLTSSILQPAGAFTPLSPQATEQTAYQRNDTTGEDTPLVTRTNDTANPFQAFGEEGRCPAEGQSVCGPEFVGASADAQHVILQSPAPLTEDVNGVPQLYEWSAGKLTLVSELPVGGSSGSGPVLGYGNEIVRNAVSQDGSRVVWSAEYNGGRHLYLRDLGRGETVQLDVGEPGFTVSTSESAEPVFQMASADGSRVFFTDGQRLTKDASRNEHSNEGDLYECEIAVVNSKLQCVLHDLTPTGPTGERARVLGELPGGSEDGSTVYFVADGKLAPGAVKGNLSSNAENEPGGLASLYVWHEGVIRLVVVLSGEDYADWNGNESAKYFEDVVSRVSPNGEWLAFMSDRDLTGYDSLDAARNGVRDEEVYVYSLASGRVVCASCDPSGARPVGIEAAAMQAGLDGGNAWHEDRMLAGSVPTWTTGGVASSSATLYQPRFLSNEGRVFFNSNDALVPGDVNGTGDVYEFEPEGVGACSSAVSSPRIVFERELAGSPVNGCVGLISSGEGSEEAGFLDASESGGDVFFVTSSKLVPEDVDTARDVYDAHECTSAAPCFPTPVTEPPPCETGESCKPAPTLQPSIFASPASTTFTSAGNVKPAATPVVKAKAKPKTRAQKLTAALKLCKRDKQKARRQACEKAAKKKYGPVKKALRRRSKR